MRVLQVVGSSYVIGSGIFSIINPLVTKLNEKKIETHVLSISENSHSEVSPFVYLYNKNFYDKDFDKYDLIIFHGVYYLEFIKLAKILRKKKIVYLIKPHSSLTKASFRKHGIRKLIFLIIFIKHFRKSKGIIYTNKEEKNNSFCFLNKNLLIEMNGIDLIPKVFPKHNDTGTINLIFLSRIDISHKGVDILLRGLEKTQKFLIDKKCIVNFYGIGHEKDMSFFYKELNKIDSKIVSFKGSLFGEEKEKIYLQSDIMLLTSRYEGFPTVLIEAAMHGIPSIVTKGTNGCFLAEKKAGWYSPSLKAEAVSRTIINAINDFINDRELYRKKSRKLAEELFDINKTVDYTIHMYESILLNKEA